MHCLLFTLQSGQLRTWKAQKVGRQALVTIRIHFERVRDIHDVIYTSRLYSWKKYSRIHVNIKKGHKTNNIKNWRKYSDSAVICSFSNFLEGENPYSRNGKWKISFKATYNEDHCEQRGKRDGKEEMSADQTQYLFSVELDERRRDAVDFYVEVNFRISYVRLLYTLSRRSSLESTLTILFFFFNLARAFVTRNIVITLWISVTAFDWQAIVDALCEFHGMIIAMGYRRYSTMDLLPAGSFVFIQGAGIETACITFFLGPVCDVRVYLRTQREAVHDGDTTLAPFAIHSY